ncbi:MAG: molybdopterin-dependent oxidoreductase [Desulfurivibrionaceae bacterium]|nr:molybdopterin-dependent oxidoreductase [Desulfurivibrionaceae bacterium]
MAFNLTRRKFLQTATLAAASVPLANVVTARAGVAKSPFTPSGTMADKTMVGGICEMCFWRCQLVGKVRDNKLMKLEGNPKSIDNGQSICARGNAGVQLLYDRDRLKYPMKNVGQRGAPKWKRISWDEALDTCAKKLKATEQKFGAKGICMFPHGASAKYPMHYLEKTVGTPNVSEASFYQCRGIRDTAFLATIGTPPGENVDMANAKVIFGLGCHFGENVHVSHVKRYLKGLENGAKLVIVDPRFSASAAKADEWVAVKPGTDTALMLGMMNYIIQQGKHNKAFIDKHGIGFAEFKDSIAEWTIEKTAQTCDVPADQIKRVADLLADNAPHVSIHPGRHVSWHGNDFQRQRSLACMMGLLGAMGVKGGFVKGKGPKGITSVTWPKGHDHVDAMHVEAGLYPFSPPGTPTDLIRDAAITGAPYPIKSCVIWGQNPIQTIPNQQKTIDMLKQMDFVMCVDVMPTDITMYADILLPEASYLERYDYIKKGTQWDLSGKQQQYISARLPMVMADFERKDQVYITNEIAKRMGYEDKIPVSALPEMVDMQLSGAGLSIAKLIAEDGIHIQPGKDPYGVADDLLVYFNNEEIADYGYPAAPTYIAVEEVPAGHFRLLYGRSPVHTFNRSQNNVWLHNAMPENPVWINDEMAKKLNLTSGDRVHCINSEGVKSRNTTIVKVTPGIRKDCVYMAHGYGSMNPALSVGAGSGIDDQALITKLAVDPETGCHGMRNNFVKLVKA